VSLMVRLCSCWWPSSSIIICIAVVHTHVPPCSAAVIVCCWELQALIDSNACNRQHTYKASGLLHFHRASYSMSCMSFTCSLLGVCRRVAASLLASFAPCMHYQ
jgi:hypothetical protein